MLSDENWREIVRRHGEAESSGDIEGTIATMEGEPVYYMLPVGKKFRGLDNVRRYYRHLFEYGWPKMEGFDLHGEYIGNKSSIVEYTVRTRPDVGEKMKEYPIICKYSFGETGITGETMYADEALFRIMAGPMWDEFEDV